MKKIVPLIAATSILLCSTSHSTLPSPLSLEQSFGPPVFSQQYKGVVFKVFSSGGLKIVAVNPPGLDTPAFLSFVKEEGVLELEEITQFLENFSATSGSPWKEFDRSVPDSALQFLMSAPYANQSAAQKMISSLPDPESAAKAWENLVRDPQARTEASNFLEMLRAQRKMWITTDGKFLATWSPDGTALGVGIVPPSAR